MERAQYLLPRWHGKAGDWEDAAEQEIERAGGGGLETYARVVNSQRDYYKNVFRESRASWDKTRQGYELLRKRYPESETILNIYARLAWMAADREVLAKLIADIGDGQIPDIWGQKGDEFARAKAWAMMTGN